jgi:hypothetical protein
MIKNILIHTTRLNNYQVFTLINGHSDDDAQIITLNSLENKPHDYQPYFRRNFNKYTMAEFKNILSYETWDPVFAGDGDDTILNSFLNTNFQICYSSFPPIKINEVEHNYSWRLIGINTCKQKRELYIASRNNNSVIKEHHKN